MFSVILKAITRWAMPNYLLTYLLTYIPTQPTPITLFCSVRAYTLYACCVGSRGEDFCRTMLCKRGLCRHAVSVCLSIRPSVTFVSCVKTKNLSRAGLTVDFSWIIECIGVGGGGGGEAIIWDRRLQVCHFACSSVYFTLYFINFLFDSVW